MTAEPARQRREPHGERGSLVATYVADPAHGPLPALLLLLTVATGLIDAVSILGLGRVFVANMTGNVAFVGFALAGAPGFSLQASLVALAGFLVGGALGGGAVRRWGAHRGMLLRNVVSIEAVLLVASTIAAAAASTPLPTAVRDLVIALAAAAFGLQNAAVRRLAVPDLTTTVLTMTLTGIAADLRSGRRRVALTRVLAVTAMFAGATVGALLVLHPGTATALAVATGVLLVVAGLTAAVSARPARWHARPD